MEYVDVEGLIQPILTIIVNARESGSVDRIVGEEGSLLQKGDTILVLENPDLIHSIEEQRDDLEKQLISFREKEIEMEQKSLTLQQQTLQTNYELARLQKVSISIRKSLKWELKAKLSWKLPKMNTIIMLRRQSYNARVYVRIPSLPLFARTRSIMTGNANARSMNVLANDWTI